jgi:dihydropteroate synthase
MLLRLRERTLELGGRARIMGIVNIGDDSVADSAHLRTLDQQLAYARRQREDGADILDVGVQSGRTDTPIMSEDEELARLLPLIRALREDGAPVSVETWRPAVAQSAIDAGASAINDVSGLADPGLADIAAATGVALVVMHTRARPKQERFLHFADPMAEVIAFLADRCNLATERGVAADQLLVDPGLDFAKTPAQSIEVLRRLDELQALRLPILLAASRKYFVGMLTGTAPEDRLAGTLAALDYGIEHGAKLLRVHDVRAVTEFLHVRATLRDAHAPELKGERESPELKWLEPKGT